MGFLENLTVPCLRNSQIFARYFQKEISWVTIPITQPLFSATSWDSHKEGKY